MVTLKFFLSVLMTFVIPHDKENLLTVQGSQNPIDLHLSIYDIYSSFFLCGLNDQQGFFEELQNRESEFGISDIQLGLATLEEVFLNIARQAELESATAEGNMVTLELASGISLEVYQNPHADIYIYIYYAELRKIELYGLCLDTCGSKICWDP